MAVSLLRCLARLAAVSVVGPRGNKLNKTSNVSRTQSRAAEISHVSKLRKRGRPGCMEFGLAIIDIRYLYMLAVAFKVLLSTRALQS